MWRLWLAGGLLALVVFTGWRIYDAGRDAERAAIERDRIETITTAREIDRRARTLPPSEIEEELLRWSVP